MGKQLLQKISDMSTGTVEQIEGVVLRLASTNLSRIEQYGLASALVTIGVEEAGSKLVQLYKEVDVFAKKQREWRQGHPRFTTAYDILNYCRNIYNSYPRTKGQLRYPNLKGLTSVDTISKIAQNEELILDHIKKAE